jgi:two-component system phosphate regulon sensor histidine kinase PhoR
MLVTSPLLAIMLLAGGGGASSVLLALAWLVVVLIAAEVLWQRSSGILAAVVEELDVSKTEAPWAVRDLKASARACREERDRLASLLEDLSSSLGEGLVVVSSDLRLRLINRVALRFCGAQEVPKGGSHLLEILRDPEVVEMVKAGAHGDATRPIVVENRRGLWEVRAFPVRDGGVVMLMSDVGLVRKASELRRQFVQDLSHELRSPLAVMRTTVEAMEGEITPRLSEILIRQVERIDRLTNELYELASIESGQVELNPEEVAIDRLVHEVIRDLGPELRRAEITVRTELEEDASCWCDRRGLYRVLSNLIDNAVKYNRKGGWIEVTSRVDGDETLLRVADNGEGIPAAEVGAVMQRFYRVDRARTPGRAGLGLGLAIVKHMMQQMDGRLDLDSREGVGTTVTLILPARQCVAINARY